MGDTACPLCGHEGELLIVKEDLQLEKKFIICTNERCPERGDSNESKDVE